MKTRFGLETYPMIRIAGLFIVLALGMTGQANAMGVGEKGNFAQVEQTLTQEHQIEVARAKYIIHPEDPSRSKTLCMKFTVNAAGNGYILVSDNMDDSKSHIEVVYGKVKNAHVYDPHTTGVAPAGVSPNSDLAEKIKKGAVDGDGVMIYGQSVKTEADGSEKIVGTTTVMANLSNNGNPAIRNRLAILLTANDVTSLDNLAQDIQFRGAP